MRMRLYLMKSVQHVLVMGLILLAGMLQASPEMIINNTGVFPDWQPKAEKETSVFTHNGKTILGGKSSVGDKCGLFRDDLGEIDNWQMMLRLSWSHNSAVGGHPTVVDFTGTKGNGYRLSMVGGILELQKLKDGQVITLAKSQALWQDFTTEKVIHFDRDAAGNMTAWVDGNEAKLKAVDSEFKVFDALYIGYGVYVHGYCAVLEQVVLKSDVKMVKDDPAAGAAAEIVFNNEGTFTDWQFKAEKETLVQPQPNRVILGGKSSIGEKCGIERNDLGGIDNWQLMLYMAWSHNNAQGGHPTIVDFTSGTGNGYRLSMVAGVMELFKLTNGKAVSLAKSKTLWSDVTTWKTIYFSRDTAGNLSAWVDGSRVRLKACDTQYNKFDSLYIGYGVYVHGYCALLNQVALKTEGRASGRMDRLFAAKNVGCKFPEKSVGVVDFETLTSPFLRTGWTNKAIQALNVAKCRTEKIDPGKLRDYLEKVDVLVINPGMFAQNDIIPLMEFLRKGKALWLVGGAPFGKAIFQSGFDGWSKVGDDKLSPEEKEAIHVFAERIIGNTAGEFRSLTGSALKDGGNLQVTDVGRQVWPFTADKFAVNSSTALPQNDSIAKQTLPPWVKREILLTCKYDSRNWIFKEDTFTGIVGEIMRHTSGEFAASRVAYLGLPIFGNSPMNPANPEFKTFAVSLLNKLMVPAGKETFNFDHNLASMPALTRENLFHYPGNVFAPLCFACIYQLNDRIFAEDLEYGGFAACQFSILWLNQMTPEGEIVDWKTMDEIVNYLTKINKKVIFDPYHFQWGALQWSNKQSVHDSVFKDRFIRAMEAICRRYKDNPTFVGLMVTPHTGTYAFAIDSSPEAKKAWADFLKNQKKYSLQQLSTRYKQKITSWEQIPLPSEDKSKEFNVGPIWADYWAFHVQVYQNFMRDTIKRVRAICPTLPLLMRGPYLEVGLSADVASEFKDVAIHCECIETTIDTEGYFRSLGKRFKIPIGGENGWPKAHPHALKMAMADYLMGGYDIFLYSFAGPRWGRDCFADFYDAAMVKRGMGMAKYPDAKLAVLIPDTTLFACRPPNFFSMEGRPHIEGALERLGFDFEGISAAFPRFDGLSVIIADGSNFVISPELRDMLVEWISRGGTFIMYPHTAKITQDESETLARTLKIKTDPGTYSIGKGKVIVVGKIPTDDAALSKILMPLQLKRDFMVTPFVSNATFEDGKKKFLILYNKRTEILGSYFTESWTEATLKSLKPTRVSITPKFSFNSVRDMRTGKKIIPNGKTVNVTLPATDYVALEFE